MWRPSLSHCASPALEAVPLLTGFIDTATRQLLERYRVGPLINYQWWQGVRRGASSHASGPWSLYGFPAQRYRCSSVNFCHFRARRVPFFLSPLHRTNKWFCSIILLNRFGIAESLYTTIRDSHPPLYAAKR